MPRYLIYTLTSHRRKYQGLIFIALGFSVHACGDRDAEAASIPDAAAVIRRDFTRPS
jgi:hypothetical protein